MNNDPRKMKEQTRWLSGIKVKRAMGMLGVLKKIGRRPFWLELVSKEERS